MLALLIVMVPLAVALMISPALRILGTPAEEVVELSETPAAAPQPVRTAGAAG